MFWRLEEGIKRREAFVYGYVYMSTYGLSAHGKVLEELLEDSVVPDLLHVVTLSHEFGYPIQYRDLYGAMHDLWSPCDFDLVRGPIRALDLSEEDKMRLAYSYVFDPTVGPRRSN